MYEDAAHEALASTIKCLLDESSAADVSTRVLLAHQHRNRRPGEPVEAWDARDEYLRLFRDAAADCGLELVQRSWERPSRSLAEGGFSVRSGSASEWSPECSIIEIVLCAPNEY